MTITSIRKVLFFLAIALAVYASAQEEAFIPEHIPENEQNPQAMLLEDQVQAGWGESVTNGGEGGAPCGIICQADRRRRTKPQASTTVIVHNKNNVDDFMLFAAKSVAEEQACCKSDGKDLCYASFCDRLLKHKNGEVFHTQQDLEKMFHGMKCNTAAERCADRCISQNRHFQQAYNLEHAMFNGVPHHLRGNTRNACTKLWQYEWKKAAGPQSQGSVYAKEISKSDGQSEATTTTAETTVGFGVGVDATVPVCGSLCGGLEARADFEVSKAISDSVGSGTYTVRAQKNEIYLPGKYAHDANGKLKEVSQGYNIFQFRFNFRETGWKWSDTMVAMPTFVQDHPEPMCFPGQFPEHFVTKDKKDCRNQSEGTKRQPFWVNKALVKKNADDYLCTLRSALPENTLITKNHNNTPTPVHLVNDRNGMDDCKVYHPFWKAMTGIKYNVATFKYINKNAILDTDSKETAVDDAINVEASVTPKVGGISTTTMAGYSQSTQKSVLKEWETENGVEMTNDCGNAGHTMFAGHNIEGWQVFQWTLRGCGRDIPSQYVMCAPVVDGMVLEPKCDPYKKDNRKSMYQFCGADAHNKNFINDCHKEPDKRDGCTLVPVGSAHTGREKKVTVPSGFTCAPQDGTRRMDKNTWYGGYTYGDWFEVTQTGQTVTVTRKDQGSSWSKGWGMNLRFVCCQ